jgi:hypothetical protein
VAMYAACQKWCSNRGADRLISRAKKSDHVLVLEWGWDRLAAALRGAKLY